MSSEQFYACLELLAKNPDVFYCGFLKDIEPIPLTPTQAAILLEAISRNWSRSEFYLFITIVYPHKSKEWIEEEVNTLWSYFPSSNKN